MGVQSSIVDINLTGGCLWLVSRISLGVGWVLLFCSQSLDTRITPYLRIYLRTMTLSRIYLTIPYCYFLNTCSTVRTYV